MEDALLDLAHRVAEAPLSAALTWPGVMRDLAKLAGGWGGQFIAAQDGRYRAYFGDSEVTPELVSEYVAAGGPDPTRNPRTGHAYAATRGDVYSDAELVSDEVRRRNELYCGFYRRVDAPYALTALLLADRGARVVVTINRTQRQGPADQRARRVFELLTPAFVAAARLQLQLEAVAADLIIGAFELVSCPAILCDANRRVRTASPTAEALLRAGTLVRQQRGQLGCPDMQSDAALADAIGRAASCAPAIDPPSSILTLKGTDGSLERLDVCPAPRSSFALGLGGAVLVIFARRSAGLRAPLATIGLTTAEVEVALAMLDGRSTDAVAAKRGVSAETIRTQQKAIYGKLDVGSRAELILKLSRLG